LSYREPKPLPREVILWGGTGQAKVVRPILEQAGARVVAVFDNTPDLPPPFSDVPVYQGEEGFARWRRTGRRRGMGFVVTIGNPHGRVRLRLHEMLVDAGLEPCNVVHPAAVVAPNATLGPGCQVMAGAVIMPEAVIGRQCIVNTKASVDHEDVLEEGVEVAPGATLCGLVYAECNAWICAGATVLPRIRIGADAVVGAGAVVIRNVRPGTTVVGVPAHELTPQRGHRTS
jgi:sugar O-acyltransferase (sialic acid O-acetyltransferase NeuD family)